MLASPPSNTVGVFRNQLLRDVRSLANISGIQLHGQETRSYYDELAPEGRTLIRGTAFSDHLPRCGDMGEDILLLDAPVPGSGTPWDWTRKRLTAPGEKWLLAGGLTPDNAQGAVDATNPWGVDVSGGVEQSRGVKDPGLIAAFSKAARAQP